LPGFFFSCFRSLGLIKKIYRRQDNSISEGEELQETKTECLKGQDINFQRERLKRKGLMINGFNQDINFSLKRQTSNRK